MSVILNAAERWAPSTLAFSVMCECCTASLGFLWIFFICADQGKASFPSHLHPLHRPPREIFFLNRLQICLLLSEEMRHFSFPSCPMPSVWAWGSGIRSTSSSLTGLAVCTAISICTDFIATIRPPVQLEICNWACVWTGIKVYSSQWLHSLE